MKLSQIMIQIAFPVYSRAADPDRIRALHERAARLHAAVIFPMLAFLAALAPLIIPLVFGPAWKPAIVPTQILCVAGGVQAILTGYPQLMLALGRARSLLAFNVCVLIVYGTAITLASRHGLLVVSITAASVYLLLLAAVYRFLLARYIGISIWNLAPELGPALCGCAALGAVAVPLSRLLASALPASLTIIVTGAVAAIVYALVLRSCFRAAWDDLCMVIVRVIPPLGRVGRRRGRAVTTPATNP